MSGPMVHANVGRVGLGNLLFPWARAEVFAQAFGLRMLAPQWTQFKIGPLLRRETDLRYYTNLFDNSEYVRGATRLLKLWRAERVDGTPYLRRLEELDEPPEELSGKLVQFRGYGGWFREDLPKHRKLVRERLERITSGVVRKQVEAFAEPLEIVVHVRRGDMPTLGLGAGFGDRQNQAESEAYFVNAVAEAREAMGRDTPVTIFTNAKPGELTELPKLGNVHVAPGHHAALTDMLLMARGRVLIASSASSFSAWASYLGGMPTLWHEERVQHLVPERPELGVAVTARGALKSATAGELGAMADGVSDPVSS
jgi:hypothetical protein